MMTNKVENTRRRAAGAGLRAALLLSLALVFGVLLAEPAHAGWDDNEELKKGAQMIADSLNRNKYQGYSDYQIAPENPQRELAFTDEVEVEGYGTYNYSYYAYDGVGDWFYLEWKNNVTFDDEKDDLQAIIYFVDYRRYVYWTNNLKYINRNVKYTLLFSDKHWGSQGGETNAFMVKLPNNCRIVGIKLNKNEKAPWSADYMRVAKADGDLRKAPVGSRTSDESDRFRDFDGRWIGGWTPQTCEVYGGDNMKTGDISEKNNVARTFFLTGNGTYNGTPYAVDGGSTRQSIYQYEFITGENGYPNGEGTITLNYTDYCGITYNVPLTIADGYEAVNPGSMIKGIGADSDFDFWHWDAINTTSMQAAAAMLTHNLYQYENISDTAFLPYTATHLQIIMPQNIKKINSISIKLDNGSANLDIQKLRFIELASVGETFWNGSYSLERLREAQGRVLAESRSGTTVSGTSTVTFDANTTSNYRGLEFYQYSSGPWWSSKGEMVGVSIQLADVLGAGVEQLLAKDGVGQQNLWTNLDPYIEECFTLKLTYRDTGGCKRVVTVPFFTTYICQLVMEKAITDKRITEFRGKAAFENLFASSSDSKDWISGLFQQNDNVGLALRLSEFQSLESLQFTYGTKPYGLVYTQTTNGGGCSKKTITDDVRHLDTAADTISIENICFYTGVTSSNFENSYDVGSLGVKFRTSLTPQYRYTSASKSGTRFSTGGGLSLTAGKGNFIAASAPERDYSNTYLVKIKTADIETAGTKSEINFSIGYTTNDGAKRGTNATSMVNASAGFFGYESYGKGAQATYNAHMRRSCLNEFTVEIPDVKSIDSITFNILGTDEWQMEYVTIGKLATLDPRRTDGKGRRSDEDHLGMIYWKRDYTFVKDSDVTARQPTLLYQNSSTKTIYFPTRDENGVLVSPETQTMNETYITSLPDSMTYEEAVKDLGLAVPKYTYLVNVTVADVVDAGSSNYFFFQLMFENGTSGVVLANQQLASDSFRQGMVESFQIKTTQNYGNVVSIRIICDNASSTSNVFDKLNIDQISVTLAGTRGVSRSWIVERVGWIDITYADEGEDEIISGIGAEELSGAEANVEIVKDFEITKIATAVDLLFAIATDSSSAAGVQTEAAAAVKAAAEAAANAAENGGTADTTGMQMNATLVYFDSEGVEHTQSFDLTKQIMSYNDTDKTHWLYRPNHFDRFVLSMTDVSSVQALYLSIPSGRSNSWVVSSVSVQQVSGLGDVYLSTAFGNGGEYYRDPDGATDLAASNNTSPITISPGSQSAFTFSENMIEVQGDQDMGSWNTNISATPNTRNDTLNLYIFPGTIMGRQTSFDSSTPAIRATVNYSTVFGGTPVSSAFNVSQRATLSDGRTMLYANNLGVNSLATLNSIKLSSTAASGEQPYIGEVIAERVRDGVLLETYYFDFAAAYLGNGNPEYSPKIGTTVSPMHQLIQLQTAPGDAAALIPQSGDILVSLRYTSALDPGGKTVYRSPYVYLTDAGYTSLSYGVPVNVPFSVNNVGQVVGLSIISTGPIVSFERALIANYAGAGSDNSVLLDSCGLTQSFVSSLMRTDVVGNGSTVAPATFTFVTGREETYAGAGTSGKVDLSVTYADLAGGERSEFVSDIGKYLPEGETFTAGSTQTISLLLPNLGHITYVTLSSEEDWFLSSVTAAASPLASAATVNSGVSVTASSATKSVNNHAAPDAPLTVEVIPVSKGGTSEGNVISSFSLTAAASNTGTSASAAAGQSLQIQAYMGDTIRFTPNISAIGSPDKTWTWIGADNSLSVSSDGSATFYVPGGASPGSTFNAYSIRANGNQQLAIPISIVIIEEPAPPVVETVFIGGDSDAAPGGDAGGTE